MVIRPLLVLGLLAGLLAPPAVTAAGPSEPPSPAGPELSTPELIERAVDRGRLGRLRADIHLAGALRGEGVPPAYRSDVPWDGTLVLLELQRRFRDMPRGEDRRSLRTALHPGPGGAGVDFCDGSLAPTTHTDTTTHFYVEYNDAELSAGPLPVGAYFTSLETAWFQEVDLFGWAAPPVLPSNPAPGDLYHVRIQNLGTSLYGFVSNLGTHAGAVGDNPNTPWDDGDAQASCMVLNSNYDPFPGEPQQALDATTAHELNHSIQFGIGGLHGSNAPDAVFFEGGATWMEDEVFDTSNDNYNYLWPDIAEDLGQYSESPYPYWVVFRAMTERFGTTNTGGGERVMQRFWEITSKNEGDTLEAMDKALQPEGLSLGAAFHDAAVALRINKACGGGYAYPHCLEEGPAYTAAVPAPPGHGSIGGIGSMFDGMLFDNYAANWIAMPTGLGPLQLILINLASNAGLFTGSLACDTGTGLRVTPFAGAAGGGERTYVRITDTLGCLAAWIVVTNVSQTEANPSSSAQQPYRLRVTEPPDPSKTKVRGRAKGDRVKAKGKVRPKQPGSKMRVVLYKKKKGKWRKVKARNRPLKKGKRFKANFPLPDARRCRLEARFPGDDDHLPSKDRSRLRC